MEDRQGDRQAVPAHPSVDFEAGGELGPTTRYAFCFNVLEGGAGGDQAISSHQPVAIKARGSMRSGAPPIDGRPVHVVQGLADPVVFAEVVDGLAAGWQDVIVDDDEAAAGDTMVEGLQRIHR